MNHKLFLLHAARFNTSLQRRSLRTLLVIPLILPALALAQNNTKTHLDPVRQWGQWRGPLAIGVAPHGRPPLNWSEDKNVRWKIPLEGKSHATPVVWGEHVFILTAEAHGRNLPKQLPDRPGAHDNMAATRRMKFGCIAIRRKDGSITWQRTLKDEQPHESTYVTGSWASPSPATDGQHLFAYFGSRGLYALDLQGHTLWETDLGDMETRHGHGEGSSPALYKDTLIINWDHQGDSFIVALDKSSGQEKWRVPRDEVTSWSSPIVVEHAGKTQVIVSATNRVRGYDIRDGSLIWECAGLSRNVVASPVSADGFVFAGNSYDWKAMLAIRLDLAKGDITDSPAVAWKLDRQTPYVPSPVLYDDTLYFLSHYQGILSCRSAKSGKRAFGPGRLPGLDQIFASPVAADNRIYILARNGKCAVVRHGGPFEILAENFLDDIFAASPAIVDGELYLRGERFLYCIAEN